MPYAINYKLLRHDAYKNLVCEIHINGQLAAILSNDDGFKLHPAQSFRNKSVTPEELQSAVNGAMEKLEAAQ